MFKVDFYDFRKNSGKPYTQKQRYLVTLMYMKLGIYKVITYVCITLCIISF